MNPSVLEAITIRTGSSAVGVVGAGVPDPPHATRLMATPIESQKPRADVDFDPGIIAETAS
jgi:hypothetical protein